MSRRQCILVTLVILIYACLVTRLLADFQNNLDSSKVINFIENVHQRNLLSTFRREGQRKFSSPCYGDIYEFIMSLLKKEIWTLKMVDAASKIPSGLLMGNINDFGMYDECLKIQENKNGTIIRGRHCFYSLGLHFNFSAAFDRLKPRLSVCVPATCNDSDVTNLLELIIFKMTNISSIGINSVTASCSNIEPPDWTDGSLSALSVIGVIIGILLGCTIIDILQIKTATQNKFVTTLSRFSVRRSGLQILHTKINPNSFPVLNGIRFLSICWIVMGHAYIERGSSVSIVNKVDTSAWLFSWDSVYVYLSMYAVDSFFTLSGFLMAYLFIKEMSNGGKFNLIQYYFHRYIRLTPAVGILIITTFIAPHLGSGPIWESRINMIHCEENWWTIILYVQNFIKTDVNCLGHLWYLAVDMQLFWFSPIILYPLSRKPKIGLIILAASFAASMIYVATVIGVNEYTLSMFKGEGVRTEKGKRMFEDTYTAPYARAGPWLVGIFFGYITASKKVKLNRSTASIGWICSLLSFVFCTLGYKHLQSKDYEYNLIFEIMFGSTYRSIWALGLSWIIFASINGYGGPVAKFLSLPIFLPLGKLSYCVYLVHALWQLIVINTIRVSTYFSEFEMFTNFLSDLVFAITIAFFFSLFFESPILILEKIIFSKKKTEAKKEFQEQEKNGKVKSDVLTIL